MSLFLPLAFLRCFGVFDGRSGAGAVPDGVGSRGATGSVCCCGGGFKQNGTKCTGFAFLRRWCLVTRRHFAFLEDAHDHGAGTMSSRVLGEVVAPRELLTAIVALEWFVMSVERSVVTFQVFLAAKTSRAKSANKLL